MCWDTHLTKHPLCLAKQFFDRDSSGTISQAEMMETNSELEDPLTVSNLPFSAPLPSSCQYILINREFDAC